MKESKMDFGIGILKGISILFGLILSTGLIIAIFNYRRNFNGVGGTLKDAQVTATGWWSWITEENRRTRHTVSAWVVANIAAAILAPVIYSWWFSQIQVFIGFHLMLVAIAIIFTGEDRIKTTRKWMVRFATVFIFLGLGMAIYQTLGKPKEYFNPETGGIKKEIWIDKYTQKQYEKSGYSPVTGDPLVLANREDLQKMGSTLSDRVTDFFSEVAATETQTRASATTTTVEKEWQIIAIPGVDSPWQRVPSGYAILCQPEGKIAITESATRKTIMDQPGFQKDCWVLGEDGKFQQELRGKDGSCFNIPEGNAASYSYRSLEEDEVIVKLTKNRQ